MKNFICIIDDDDVYQYTASKTIKALHPDKQIINFNDGVEALEYFKSNFSINTKLPDVVFLDVNMPYMDGWEFITEYDKIGNNMAKKIKFYIITSSVSEYERKKAESLSRITGFYTKPIGIDEYSAILREAA